MNEVLSGTTWGIKITEYFGDWKCTKVDGDSKISIAPGNSAVSLENVPE